MITSITLQNSLFGKIEQNLAIFKEKKNRWKKKY